MTVASVVADEAAGLVTSPVSAGVCAVGSVPPVIFVALVVSVVADAARPVMLALGIPVGRSAPVAIESVPVPVVLFKMPVPSDPVAWALGKDPLVVLMM